MLVHKDGYLSGIDVASEDVEMVNESSEGFAQLAYQLIKLGSLVIEKKLIVYRA